MSHVLVHSQRTRPIHGVGIGLRSAHVEQLLDERPAVPWLEVLADNALSYGGSMRRQLHALRAHYPMTLHCVSLSLGSAEPVDQGYLDQLKRLKAELEPAWISDHLCWSSFEGRHSHDLLPLPCTEEALTAVADKLSRIQDQLQEAILIENVSSYLRFKPNDFSEADFISELCRRTGCFILLDLNNTYVNQYNHGIDGVDFINRLPAERVREVHLAGFERQDAYLLDAHNNPVSEDVWALYGYFQRLRPGAPTLIEWDNDIPELSRLLAEADLAARKMREATEETSRAAG